MSSPTTTADAAGSSSKDDPESKATRVKKRRMGVDPSLIISEERSKRRRTPTPEPEDDKNAVMDPKDPQRAKALGMQMYNKVLSSVDRDGISMSEPFLKLPNKRALPDYYEIIKHPISLDMVKAKLDAGEYETLKAVVTDLGQMFTNAKRYNVKESLIFAYAKKLHKMTRTMYATLTSTDAHESESEQEAEPPAEPVPPPLPTVDSGDGQPEEDADMGGPSTASADGETSGRTRKRGSYMKDGPTVYKLIKPVLRAIKDARARDGSGRDVSGIFMELPKRDEFPDYYLAIKKPISLQEIEESCGRVVATSADAWQDKMLARIYETWEQFFDDVELMCANAQLYNEDDSEVFKDAQQIRDILAFHRKEIPNRITAGNQARFRVRSTNPTPTRYTPTSSMPSTDYHRSSIPIPPYPTHQSQPYARPTPSPAPLAGTPTHYLPALPSGVVTEEVVTSLPRYPMYEQRAWLDSLPPLQMQMYRQMAAANEAKKRGFAPPATPSPGFSMPSLRDLPSSGRPNGVSALPDRQAPPVPAISAIDFTFSTPSTTDPDLRPTVRLYNMRGVVTHAVFVGAETSELELTAYVAESPATPAVPARATADEATATTTTPALAPATTPTSSPAPTPTPAATNGNAQTVEVPEVSLRVNGNPGSLPKFVLDDEKHKTIGMRWSVVVPLSRVETKIEIVATKPGSMAETSTIYACILALVSL